MLIAITGHKFSGKSTVARLLHNATGWEIVSFATPLKKMVCALVGCTMDDLEDYDYKENTEVPEHLWAYCANCKHTVRALMQGLGDLMRKENPNVFIECTLNSKGDYLVSDCRFPNEAKAVKERGGIVIKVMRPDVKASDSHQSETRIDEIDADYTLWNDTTLENLVLNVDSLVRLLRGNGKI